MATAPTPVPPAADNGTSGHVADPADPLVIAGIAWIDSLTAKGSKVPKSWLTNPPANQKHGIYTLSAGAGYGTVSWTDPKTKFNQSLYFAWDETTGAITTAPAAPDSGQVHDVLTAPFQTLVGGADAVGNAIDTIPKFLAAITAPAFWQRVGVGAAGAIILIVVLVVMTKRAEKSTT